MGGEGEGRMEVSSLSPLLLACDTHVFAFFISFFFFLVAAFAFSVVVVVVVGCVVCFTVVSRLGRGAPPPSPFTSLLRPVPFFLPPSLPFTSTKPYVCAPSSSVLSFFRV